MEISRYKPLDPPTYLRGVMAELIIIQKYRDFKYEKPPILNPSPLQPPQIPSIASQTQVSPPNSVIKTKIIRKIKSQQIDIGRQKKVHRLRNLLLMQQLNASVMDAKRRNQPAPLSVLESRQEGDFLLDGDKKEHPHYSNTIKVTEIPRDVGRGYIPSVAKKKEEAFSIEENCVLKVKQFRQFINLLFEMGNDEFEGIAARIGLSTSTTKLMYDLSNDYFRVESGLDVRAEEVRRKMCKNIHAFVNQAIKRFHRKQQTKSCYVPPQEEFMSLKELRECFSARLDEDSDRQSESS